LLAAGLTLGVAAVMQTQTLRADSVIFDDHFNNATNDISNNDSGVGGGFTAFSYNNLVNLFAVDAFETSIWNGVAGHFAILANSTIGDLYASLDTINPLNLSGGGTTFELSGVSFSTNTPIANGGGGGAGNVDRLIWGVSTIAPAGAWLSAGVPGAIPTGFWIQFNSDSLVTGTGQGSWSGTSTLFYKDTGTNVYQLCSWKFDNLYWTNGVYHFSPTLDVKLTLSGTGWALNITGDTATNQPISYRGTYAAGGVLAGTTNLVAINPLLFNGLNSSYLGGFNQTANPGIAMQIDEVKVYQVGNLAVTTPQFNTPGYFGVYGYNTNIVLAGEALSLVSFVTDSAATPTLQWQMANLAVPGTFTNLPNGNATNVSVNTTGLGDSLPRGIRLIANDTSGNSVTSAVVLLTVNAASAPVDVQDPSPSALNLYLGQGGSFSANFAGNLPISYQWQSGPDGFTYTNIPSSMNATATNNYLVVPSANAGSVGFYQLVASNSLGVNYSAAGYVNLLAGTPQYLWSANIPFGGLNSDQILTNFPSTYKIAGAMYAANGGPALVVTTGQGNITFGPNGFTTATVSGGSGYGIGVSAPQTGNANFNTCLNSFYSNATPHVITLSNLVVGQKYQVQLFGLDDRRGRTANLANWQDPADASDTSINYQMGANVYTLGTFTATNTVHTIRQNLVNTTNGNFNCLVLRAVGWSPAPYFALQPTNQSLFATNASLVGIAGGDSSLGAITYQWMAGPTNGPYSVLSEGGKYTGTQSNSLTINNLVAADGNLVYVLKASNGGGSLNQNSREVTLVIQSIPPAPALGSYAAAALLNNPVALWMFTETNNPSTGILKGYDYTGNGHFVTYGTGAQNGFNAVLGPQSPTYPGFATNETAAKTANNNTSYVSVPPLNDTNLATTVAMWINPADNGNYAHGLIGNRNNTVAGQIWQLGYSAGNGTLGYNWNDVSATYTYNSGLAPVIGSWNFVAMVITSNNATFYLYYLNGAGQAILSKAVNAAPNTTPITMAGGTTVIGSDPYDLTSRGFNGAIAGVALYNSALSESQVQTMFAVGVGISTNFPPAFVTQPAATNTVFPGYNLQLSATTSSGTPPVTNQWTLNGTNLVDGYYGADHQTHIVGSTSNVLSITYITTNWAGTYNLILSNSVTFVASSNSVVIVSQPAPAPAANLVGNWFAGPQNLTNQATANDPGNIYSGSQIKTGGNNQGSYTWASDLPPNNNGGSSINLNNTGILINNTSTNDAGYQNTFDVGISNQFSVSFWAKGWPGGWNAFVSKYGEGPGWQLRNDGNNNTSPCWTIRGNGGTVAQGLAVFGNSEDMAATSLTYGNDGKWHFYCGTYSLSAGQRQLFVDGALVAYTTGEGQYNTSPATHLVLGAKDQPPGSPGNFNNTNNFTGYFTGEMYDVRIYNTNLNASQQASIYGTPPEPTVLAFATQPAATNNTFPGFKIQLSATSTGYAPITNQWQLNGANLADGNYGSTQVIGSKSNVLTIISMTTNFAGTYKLLLSNQFTNLVSSNAVVNVLQPAPPPAGNLVGKWFAGAQSLADVSGHNPGVHDGSQIQVNNANQGSYGWASDLPAINSGGSSISLTNTGILINNTSTNDAGYENTFDVGISNQFSITCWAKGFPGSWNAWVSKFGETSPAPAGGWQLRQYAGNGTSTFTLRGTGSAQAGGDDQQGSINSNDGKWHLYVGTYNPTTKVRSLYVDGTLSVQSTDNGQYTTAPECHLAIGAKDQPPGSPANYNKTNNFTGYFTGEMYDVRIYNVELTINQQAYLYSTLASLPVVNRPVVSGNNLVLSWTGSALLTATNITGPWTTNTVTSPATNPMTLQQQFFKAQQ
jgi:hypothetical protein